MTISGDDEISPELMEDISEFGATTGNDIMQFIRNCLPDGTDFAVIIMVPGAATIGMSTNRNRVVGRVAEWAMGALRTMEENGEQLQ